MPLNDSTFAGRLQTVEDRIRKAVERSGRKRSDLTLVGVSKKFSAVRMREAYTAGIRDFGENYIQEFTDKQPDLKDLQDVRFHFIGHLQSNKARIACELFDMIETADSVKILERLNASAGERAKILEVLVEVKLSDEANKAGVAPEALPGLLDKAESWTHLRLSGLMTMPPWSEDAERSRPYFKKLAVLARQYELPQLSMGMSNDFEVAIDEGATIIRVGTALFGRRPSPLQSGAAPPSL